MITSILKLIVQIIIILLIAPIFTGVIKVLKAKAQHKIGPSIFQPYYNLIKLFKKDLVVSNTSSWIYNVAPYIYFVTSLTALLCLPLVNQLVGFTFYTDLLIIVYLFVAGRVFMALAGLDTGSAFGGMGSSREMLVSALAEPALFIIIITVSARTDIASTNVSSIYNYMVNHTELAFTPINLLLFVSMLMVLIAESSRIPVDDPSTHLELTMVHEAMVLEYSGRHLAFIELGTHIKQLVFMTFMANILIPVGFNVANIFLGFGIYLLKIFVITILVALVELNTVKLRLYSIPNFAAIAFIVSVLGFLTSFILK
ncbi:NADH-quinone oxidoreductase subunit H [Ruminiclostridium herbifermentans]|uniref:NADH-quinone oxidoreductase subunit H n=1 Tax=Ruminiclostridium herbifermentans TaxID=2488810 RepID=A0A4U7JIN5_9FIRM|nr:NADH-quinone oxidoreductase subunit H [Ruminiclostridium herbifermentans]QNU68831.1 NADH-quinone oxidoreductase subunit H [Ruminiclostridium herbifermentans]